MRATDPRILPRSGLSVTALGLGGAQIGGLYHPTSAAEAAELMNGAWQMGVRYFDTAPYYGYTRSEHRVGEALCDRPRHEFVLSTKVGRLLIPDARVSPGDDGWADPLPFRPRYDYTHAGIMRSYEDSRQRLGMQRIDILFVHDIGSMTHGEAHPHYWSQLTTGGGFRALEELRDAGQTAAIGLGVNEWQVVHAAMQEASIDCTLLAGRYTLLEQSCLAPFLDDCVRQGTSIVIGGAFNSGILAGSDKFNYADAPVEVVQRVRALAAVCEEFGVPLPAAALQFPMAHPAVVSCLAGARNLAQLRQNIAWFERSIPAELWSTLRARGLLDAAAPLPPHAAICPDPID